MLAKHCEMRLAAVSKFCRDFMTCSMPPLADEEGLLVRNKTLYLRGVIINIINRTLTLWQGFNLLIISKSIMNRCDSLCNPIYTLKALNWKFPCALMSGWLPVSPVLLYSLYECHLDISQGERKKSALNVKRYAKQLALIRLSSFT